MTPGQHSIPLEIDALARILGVPLSQIPRTIRHMLKDAGTATLNNTFPTIDLPKMQIPVGECLLVTRVSIASYPLDEQNIPVYGNRQPGGYVDNFYLSFALNGQGLYVATNDYHNLSGNLFLPFGEGSLSITIKPVNLSVNVANLKVNSTVSGYLLPMRYLAMLNAMATTQI